MLRRSARNLKKHRKGYLPQAFKGMVGTGHSGSWGSISGLSETDRADLVTGSWAEQKDAQTEDTHKTAESELSRLATRGGDRDAPYYGKALQEAKDKGQIQEAYRAEVRADEAEATVPTMALASEFFTAMNRVAESEMDGEGSLELDEDGNPVGPIEPMTQAQREEQRRAANRNFFGQYCAMQGVIPFPQDADEAEMEAIVANFLELQSRGCVDSFYSVPWTMPLTRLVTRQQLESFYVRGEKDLIPTNGGPSPRPPLQPLPWRDDIFTLKVPRYNKSLSPMEQVMLENYAAGLIPLPEGTEVEALRPLLGPAAVAGLPIIDEPPLLEGIEADDNPTKARIEGLVKGIFDLRQPLAQQPSESSGRSLEGDDMFDDIIALAAAEGQTADAPSEINSEGSSSVSTSTEGDQTPSAITQVVSTPLATSTPDTTKMLDLIQRIELAQREQVPEASLTTLQWLQKASASGSINPTSRLASMVSMVAVSHLLKGQAKPLLVDMWPHPQWGLDSGHEGLYWEASQLMNYVTSTGAVDGQPSATFVALHDSDFLQRVCPTAVSFPTSARKVPHRDQQNRRAAGEEWDELTHGISHTDYGVEGGGTSAPPFPSDRFLRGCDIAHMAAPFSVSKNPPKALLGSASVVLCVPPTTRDATRLAIDDVMSSTLTNIAVSKKSDLGDADSTPDEQDLTHNQSGGLEDSLPCNTFISVLTHQQRRCCGKQISLLTKGLRMLAEGGRLIYCTTTLDPHQNERIISTALHHLGGVVGIDGSTVEGQESNYRCLPAYEIVGEQIDSELFQALNADAPTPTAMQTALYEWAAVDAPSDDASVTSKAHPLPASEAIPLSIREHVGAMCLRMDPLSERMEGLFVAIIERVGKEDGTGVSDIPSLPTGQAPAVVEAPPSSCAVKTESQLKVAVSAATKDQTLQLLGTATSSKSAADHVNGKDKPLFPPLSLMAYGTAAAVAADWSFASVGLQTFLNNSNERRYQCELQDNHDKRGHVVTSPPRYLLPKGCPYIPTSLTGTEELSSLLISVPSSLPPYIPITVSPTELLTLLHLPSDAQYGNVIPTTIQAFLGGDANSLKSRWGAILKDIALGLLDTAKHNDARRVIKCANVIFSVKVDTNEDAVALHPAVLEDLQKVKVVCHIATAGYAQSLERFIEDVHVRLTDGGKMLGSIPSTIKVPFNLSFGHNAPAAPLVSGSKLEAHAQVKRIAQLMAPITLVQHRVGTSVGVIALRDSLAFCNKLLGGPYQPKELLSPYSLYEDKDIDGLAKGFREAAEDEPLSAADMPKAEERAERSRQWMDAGDQNHKKWSEKKMKQVSEELEADYGLSFSEGRGEQAGESWLAKAARRRRRQRDE